MRWAVEQLDHYVAETDRLGGPGSPGCQALWADFTYDFACEVDQNLDPFSEAYVAQQVRLYEEIAGHRYEADRDEHTPLDVERHAQAVNPYDHPDPAGLAVHLQRLSRAFRYAKSHRNEVLLDMGCGWGLSSEIAAYLGLTVIAVDINPSFVRLVNERAKRGSRAISAVQSTFDDFKPDQPVDLAMFYECLHHAIRPWMVTSRIANSLKVGGRLILAGEPINDFWWKNWGIRLDPASIYCIRKFGWFESGWSIRFIEQTLHRSGLLPRIHNDNDPEIGYVIVAEKQPVHEVPGDMCAGLFAAKGCIVDGIHLIFRGSGEFTLSFPEETSTATIKFTNHRGRELRLSMWAGDELVFKGDVRPGYHGIEVKRRNVVMDVRLEVERWVPAEEQQTVDDRILGLHLGSIMFN